MHKLRGGFDVEFEENLFNIIQFAQTVFLQNCMCKMNNIKYISTGNKASITICL